MGVPSNAERDEGGGGDEILLDAGREEGMVMDAGRDEGWCSTCDVKTTGRCG